MAAAVITATKRKMEQHKEAETLELFKALAEGVRGRRSQPTRGRAATLRVARRSLTRSRTFKRSSPTRRRGRTRRRCTSFTIQTGYRWL